MGRPKTRNGIPSRPKCAAIDSPYGPAPTITVFNITLRKDLSGSSRTNANKLEKYGQSYHALGFRQWNQSTMRAGMKVTRGRSAFIQQANSGPGIVSELTFRLGQQR